MLAAAALTAGLALHACTVPKYGRAECGSFVVPENRAHPGRMLHLRFALFRAPGSDHRDAVVPLAGGPGEGALELLEDYLPVEEFTRIRARHDILAVDARGRGHSDLVLCPVTDENPQSLFTEELFDRKLIERCRLHAEKQADLTQYNDVALSDDLDELRRALGYETLTLQGASGGTLSSFVYARRYPQRVRAIAGEGIAPVYSRVPLHYARAATDAIDGVIADCSREPKCRHAYPNLRGDYTKIVARVSKGPVHASLDPKITRRGGSVSIGRAAFAEQVRYLLYDAHGMALLPFLIHAAAGGDWMPFASVAYADSAPFIDAGPHGISNIVYFSTTCSESVPYIDPASVKRETAGTLAGESRVAAHVAICRRWPHAVFSKDFVRPVHGTMPVLLLSGEWDPATIPSDAVKASRDFTHARLIQFKKSGHSVDVGCASAILATFIERPRELGTIDARCARAGRIDYAYTYDEIVRRTRL